MIGITRLHCYKLIKVTNAQLEPDAQTGVSPLIFNLTSGFSLKNPYFVIFYFQTTISRLSLLSKAIA